MQNGRVFKKFKNQIDFDAFYNFLYSYFYSFCFSSYAYGSFLHIIETLRPFSTTMPSNSALLASTSCVKL